MDPVRWGVAVAVFPPQVVAVLISRGKEEKKKRVTLLESTGSCCCALVLQPVSCYLLSDCWFVTEVLRAVAPQRNPISCCPG